MKPKLTLLIEQVETAAQLKDLVADFDKEGWDIVYIAGTLEPFKLGHAAKLEKLI